MCRRSHSPHRSTGCWTLVAEWDAISPVRTLGRHVAAHSICRPWWRGAANLRKPLTSVGRLAGSEGAPLRPDLCVAGAPAHRGGGGARVLLRISRRWRRYLLTRSNSDFNVNVPTHAAGLDVFDAGECTVVDHDPETHQLRVLGRMTFGEARRSSEAAHYEVLLTSRSGGTRPIADWRSSRVAAQGTDNSGTRPRRSSRRSLRPPTCISV